MDTGSGDTGQAEIDGLLCKTVSCRSTGRSLPTVLELRASLMRFSAALTSSRMASVSEFLSEFRWSCTFTQILSIICGEKISVRTRKWLSCAGTVRLLNGHSPAAWWLSRCPAAACRPVPAGISWFHGSCTDNSQSGETDVKMEAMLMKRQTEN